jgi:VanZ family protein
LRLALAVAALAVNVFFYLPRTPAAAEAVSFPGADKAFHVLVFALTVWAVGRLLAPARRFPIGWVAIGALANALLIEAVQGLFLPERSADVGDLVADAVGIVLGLVAWWYERRRRAVADAEF